MMTDAHAQGLYTSEGRIPTPRPGLTPAERARLIEAYSGLVKKVAFRIAPRVPASVDVQDLIAAGTVGLLTALDRYDESRGKPFEVFAEWRIKGAILDELRAHDHLTRGARMRSREMQRVRRDLEQQLGRRVGVEEVAEAAGVDLEDAADALGAGEGPGFVSLEDLGIDRTDARARMGVLRGSGPPDPYENAFLSDLRRRLAAAIERLPERLRLVLSLYYEKGMNYREIGAVLDRTESRVCQLHREAVLKLRRMLGDDGADP